MSRIAASGMSAIVRVMERPRAGRAFVRVGFRVGGSDPQVGPVETAEVDCVKCHFLKAGEHHVFLARGRSRCDVHSGLFMHIQ